MLYGRRPIVTRCQVIDEMYATHGTQAGVVVRHRMLTEAHAWLRYYSMRQHSIEYAHVHTLRHQGAYQVKANEATAAGD
jgi:hypothetical protein